MFQSKISDIQGLEDKLKELTSVTGESINLSDYVKAEELENYAKANDITTLTNTLNQLIVDLQEGKYNVGVTSNNTTEDTSTKSTKTN